MRICPTIYRVYRSPCRKFGSASECTDLEPGIQSGHAAWLELGTRHFHVYNFCKTTTSPLRIVWVTSWHTIKN